MMLKLPALMVAILFTSLLVGCTAPAASDRVVEIGNTGSIHGGEMLSVDEHDLMVRRSWQAGESGQSVVRTQLSDGAFEALRQHILQHPIGQVEGDGRVCMDYGRDRIALNDDRQVSYEARCPDSAMDRLKAELMRIIAAHGG